METVAAVMTSKGTGAIATISLFGPDADNILRKIFNPPSKLKAGQTALGAITVNGNVIDQVLIGCEGVDNFTINCHGNPLIVSDILRLLEKKGASTVSTERLLIKKYSQMSTIAIEAKLVMADIKTLDGTRIVSNQIGGGLTKAVKSWQQTVENGSPEKVRPEAKTILQNSKKTRPLIYGCKIVLAGAPNSGKSTLLNRLAGKEKAIVTDIKGTTRDWVSTDCQLGKLSAEVIDTAG
ncbi:MAG: 50S ribosome-binding GTPase, partial [Phycisphaerales bacterium]